MKKIILTLLLAAIMTTGAGFAADKYSQEYLKNKKHFAIMNPVAERLVEHGIKSALRKETKAKFDVKFSGYTLSSMKKGIFKSLELSGKDVQVEEVTIPYVHLKTLTDYNYIDYTTDPVQFKSDMKFAYDLELNDEAINQALKQPEYQKVMNKVNSIAYPLFMIKGVRTKIVKNRVYLVVEYNFPIAPSSKNKTFVSSSNFKVVNGKVKATDVHLDSAYGNISLEKVANLINLLNPLEFTMDLLDSKKCNANIENVNIIDNKIKIDGKIYVKGD